MSLPTCEPVEEKIIEIAASSASMSSRDNDSWRISTSRHSSKGSVAAAPSRRRSRHKLLSSSEAAGKRRSFLHLESTVTSRTRQLLESLAKHSSQSSLRNLKDALSSSFSKRDNSKEKVEVKELAHDDVEIGKLVGKGGFSHVYELKNVRRRSFLKTFAFENVDGIGFDSQLNDDDGSASETSGSAHSRASSSSSSESAAKNFVVKHLAATVRGGDREKYAAAAADLAFEAKLLSSISHPNIVRLRGVTRGCEISALYAGGKKQQQQQEDAIATAQTQQQRGEEEGGGGFDGGYFIILDKLECTLKERIAGEWRAEIKVLKKKTAGMALLRRLSSFGTDRVDPASSSGDSQQQGEKSFFRRLSSFGTDQVDANDCSGRTLSLSHHSTKPSKTKSASGGGGSVASSSFDRKAARREFLLRRLDVARQIARAMKYMHSKRILYRDLKPENVGFDSSTGDVKIFDFGLARFLPEEEEVDNGQQKKRPTGMAGTMRYMAPEVYQCREYGLSADSYSFGLLLWEIMALKSPFGEKITPRQMQEKVMYGTKRPSVDWSRWPEEVGYLMERCWSANPRERPDFGEVLEVLDRELEGGGGKPSKPNNNARLYKRQQTI